MKIEEMASYINPIGNTDKHYDKIMALLKENIIENNVHWCSYCLPRTVDYITPEYLPLIERLRSDGYYLKMGTKYFMNRGLRVELKVSCVPFPEPKIMVKKKNWWR